MKNIFRFLLVTPIVVMLLVGCGGFVSNAYKTMYTVGIAYDAGMRSIGDLYSKGKLTKDQLDKVLPIASKVQKAYKVAVSALSVYEKVDSSENKDKLQVAIDEMVVVWDELKNLLTLFVPSVDSLELQKISSNIDNLVIKANFAMNKEVI